MLKKFLGLFGSKEGAPGTAAAETHVVHRASRVQLRGIHRIYFLFKGVSDKPLELANISSTGVGLLRAPDQVFPAAGSTSEGLVMFGEKQFPVKIRVVYVGPMTVGCAFVGDIGKLKGQNEEYFSAELGALQLSEVKRDILKEEPDGEPRLFRSQDNCELFIVVKQQALVRFQLSFFGNYIEGGPRLPTKYGYMYGEGESVEKGPRYKGSGLVRLVSGLPVEVMEAATKFVVSVPSLDNDLMKAICAAVRQGSKPA